MKLKSCGTPGETASDVHALPEIAGPSAAPEFNRTVQGEHDVE